MTHKNRMHELLSRWSDLRRQGIQATATEICHDCPELQPEFESRLQGLADRAEFLDVAGEETSHPTPDGPTPPPTPTTGVPPGEITQPPRAASPGDRFPYLDPPRGPNELGWLADYRILAIVGEGGMGVVFRAEEQRPRRLVALKVMKPECLCSGELRQRFLREGQAMAEIQHDRVIPIFRVSEANGVLFLAMPLLQGEPLNRYLKRAPNLPLAQVLRLGREMAEGLHAIHAAGLVHRDLKPGNIFLVRGSEEEPTAVKILDFGLARMEVANEEPTGFGMVLGTATHMAPEQAEGQEVDARADLFSLGCILYRLCTGGNAFTGPTVISVLQQVASYDPPAPDVLNPNVSPAVAALIMQLLAKQPQDRPASARLVIETLRRLESGAPAVGNEAPTQSFVPATRHRPQRWPMAVALAALVCLLGGTAWWLLNLQAPADPPTHSHHGVLKIAKPEEPSRATTPVAPVQFQGRVDMNIWRPEGTMHRELALNKPGALPLRPGDKYRIQTEVTPRGYLYLFYIDTEGKPAPLYPWKPGNWGTRPTKEEPQSAVALPVTKDRAYTISGDKEGMDTLLLLVRETPLPLNDEELKKRFAGLTEQRPVQNALAAVWYDNGKVVTYGDRLRHAFEETDLNDPVLRLQTHVSAHLQPLAAFTSSVSFARLGKE